VINEGNHRTWRQPSDPEGLWEGTLLNPGHHADFVVASEGDPASVGVQMKGLIPIAQIRVPGQAMATIYGTHSQPQ
jgi:hypothetical protein